VTDDSPMEIESDDELNSMDTDTDDETKLNSLLNDFSKHLANTLPVAAASPILKDMQVCFDTYHEQFVHIVRNRLQLLDFEWKGDAVLQELFCDDSVFERCQKKFESEYLFAKYLGKT